MPSAFYLVNSHKYITLVNSHKYIIVVNSHNVYNQRHCFDETSNVIK